MNKENAEYITIMQNAEYNKVMSKAKSSTVRIMDILTSEILAKSCEKRDNDTLVKLSDEKLRKIIGVKSKNSGCIDRKDVIRLKINFGIECTSIERKARVFTIPESFGEIDYKKMQDKKMICKLPSGLLTAHKDNTKTYEVGRQLAIRAHMSNDAFGVNLKKLAENVFGDLDESKLVNDRKKLVVNPITSAVKAYGVATGVEIEIPEIENYKKFCETTIKIPLASWQKKKIPEVESEENRKVICMQTAKGKKVLDDDEFAIAH